MPGRKKAERGKRKEQLDVLSRRGEEAGGKGGLWGGRNLKEQRHNLRGGRRKAP